MCDSTFTFGQRGSHFFQCPSKLEHTQLPHKLNKLLNSPHMKKIHHVALGCEDSFLLTWRDTNNEDRIDFAGLPTDLVAFLHARKTQGRLSRNLPEIRCVLGPYNDSWYVHDSDAYSWTNLPTKLLTALQSKITDGNWIDRPRIVTLGAGSDFVLLTDKQDAVWNLDHYNATSMALKRSSTRPGGVANIHDIFLHPYRYESFVAQSTSGMLTFDNLPTLSMPGVKAMIEPMRKDTKNIKWRPLAGTSSNTKIEAPRRPSVLQQRASIKREWSQHSQEFSAQAKGMKVSLSLSPKHPTTKHQSFNANSKEGTTSAMRRTTKPRLPRPS
ncbi:hypothetical protein T440DRAFT_492619 [Plenodomus tracheiphilus IPT5]|uniref:Uncharacterized protein n=1 Tax=Plenodomus tracheiphilus IPT5 TaxID=1408161 RepID=A0A6A7AUP8_9PLEO|nr:hypothetical protein T440DRAFT_492619 [Plenodomus tracheiphilus IPT5]